MNLRRFNEAGVAAFRIALAEMRTGARLSLPGDLIDAPALSDQVGTARVEPRLFANKLDIAKYLDSLLGPLRLPNLLRDTGLWAWLSAYYFDQICPLTKTKRKVLADPLYIPDFENHLRRYRHLLAAPLELLQSLPDHNRLLLHTRIDRHPDVIEQVSGRLNTIRVPGLREAMDLLYFDPATDTVARGVLSQDQPGSLRRFIKVAQQLDLTLDLSGMSGEQVVAALPPRIQPMAKVAGPQRTGGLARAALFPRDRPHP